MNIYKIIKFNNEARSKMLDGINILADSVKVTLGPKGKLVCINNQYSFPKTTKDGVSVAKEIKLYDPFEDMGAQMVKNVAAKTCSDVGDGTTTATILAQAIVKKGVTYVTAGVNASDLKKGIQLAVKEVVKYLKLNARPLDSYEDIKAIASISANNDFELGKIIADGIEEIGRDGEILVEEGNGTKTKFTAVKGIRFDEGYVSPHFITNPEKGICELLSPYVFIYDKNLTSFQRIMPLMETVARQGRFLVVIAPDVDGEAASALILNTVSGKLKSVAIKSPSFNQNSLEFLNDIALYTGATIISEDRGIPLEDAGIQHLGTVNRIQVHKDHTLLIGSNIESKELIKEKCQDLTKEMNELEDPEEKKKLAIRIARLKGGIGVLSVGGSTVVEMKEITDRVDDAVQATKAALQEGILPGGGVALLKASLVLKDLKGDNYGQNMGIEIVRDALRAPCAQIAENCGLKGDIIVENILKNESFSYGFNALTEEYADMYEAKIIDPAKVVRIALEDASSIASLLVNTEVIISEDPEKSDQSPFNPQRFTMN